MRFDTLELDTTGRQYVDLTPDVRSFCTGAGDGLCSVFVAHATAGLVVIEAGAGTEEDLEELCTKLLPKDRDYRHQHGVPGHGADHLTTALFSPSLVVPVRSGELQLGTWQSIVMVDRNPDNPHRKVHLSLLEG